MHTDENQSAAEQPSGAKNSKNKFQRFRQREPDEGEKSTIIGFYIYDLVEKYVLNDSVIGFSNLAIPSSIEIQHMKHFQLQFSGILFCDA